MNLVDANVLLYAVDEDSRDHDVSRAWLEAALSGGSPVLLPWVSLLAFMRIASNPRIYDRPLDWSDAVGHVESWLASPHAWVAEPDGRHLERMSVLLKAMGRGGNVINDAHLAALALQHNATVVTFDTDFARFKGIRTFTPGE